MWNGLRKSGAGCENIVRFAFDQEDITRLDQPPGTGDKGGRSSTGQMNNAKIILLVNACLDQTVYSPTKNLRQLAARSDRGVGGMIGKGYLSSSGRAADGGQPGAYKAGRRSIPECLLAENQKKQTVHCRS